MEQIACKRHAGWWLGNLPVSLFALLFIFIHVSAAAQPIATSSGDENSAALLEKYSFLAPQLARNAYGRPLYLESSENSNTVSGNAYAVLDSPFKAVSTTFKMPHHWCEVMILHINTKFCRAASDDSPTKLNVNIGKKTAQDLADSFALEFDFRVVSTSPNYLAVQLNSDKGPLGTNNYSIELRAAPLPNGKTFIHLRYSYGYGLAGRLAMQGYLATLGSGKIGFTQDDKGSHKGYVGGMRGAVERNTMRYYLAIEAYLAATGVPASAQFEARLEHWFRATEQYPRQLHEMDLNSYTTMKKSEYQRQQSGVAS
jgi:hypothetical protein